MRVSRGLTVRRTQGSTESIELRYISWCGSRAERWPGDIGASRWPAGGAWDARD